MGLKENDMKVRDNKMRPGEWDRRIGAKLRLARIDAGLSQARLAEELDCSYQQVQKYESGKNRVTTENLIRVADFLGKPVSYFIGRDTSTPDHAAVDGVERFLMSKSGRSLAKVASDLNENSVRALLKMAQSMRAGV